MLSQNFQNSQLCVCDYFKRFLHCRNFFTNQFTGTIPNNIGKMYLTSLYSFLLIVLIFLEISMTTNYLVQYHQALEILPTLHICMG